MGRVNVGVSIADAEDIARKQESPAPVGLYELQCIRCQDTDDEGNTLTTKKGRPQVVFHLAIVGASDPDLNGKTIRVYCPLPHNGDMTWISRLVNTTKGLGKPYSSLGFETEDYVGVSGRANVTISKDGIWNEIESWL